MRTEGVLDASAKATGVVGVHFALNERIYGIAVGGYEQALGSPSDIFVAGQRMRHDILGVVAFARGVLRMTIDVDVEPGAIGQEHARAVQIRREHTRQWKRMRLLADERNNAVLGLTTHGTAAHSATSSRYCSGTRVP